jgi:Uma2 family endonuclease
MGGQSASGPSTAAAQSQKVERNGRVLGEGLINPTVTIVVLSDSTEEYDRGEKFAHYIRIPSLKEYVLVSQALPKIEIYRRPERGHWIPPLRERRQDIEGTLGSLPRTLPNRADSERRR